MRQCRGKQDRVSTRVRFGGAVLAAVMLTPYAVSPNWGNLRKPLAVSRQLACAEAQGAVASASAAAFLKAFPVFMSPRCVNCHPKGDSPLQGDDSRPHAMEVRRGPDGMGKNGLWCGTCHLDHGLAGAHLPPAAPDWEMPQANSPMVFENLSARQLCRHLKDPNQNGGRTPQEVVIHVREAPLVLWGWNPGEGRTPVAMPHQEFVGYLSEWAQNGADCP